MSPGYRFHKLYELRTSYLSQFLFASWVTGLALLIRYFGLSPWYAALAAYLSCLIGIDSWIAEFCFKISGFERKRVGLTEDEELQLATQLKQAKFPPGLNLDRLRVNLMNIGPVPFFGAGRRADKPLLWISTHTLRETPAEDLPWLLLMASPFLRPRPRVIFAAIFGFQWAFVGGMAAIMPEVAVAIVPMMALIMPLMFRYLNYKVYANLYNWLGDAEEQQAFAIAMLRYRRGTERTSKSTVFRRNMLFEMGIPKEEAFRLLELADRSMSADSAMASTS